MKPDIPERVWICPLGFEKDIPRKKIFAFRDPEEGCPEATRKECWGHTHMGCPGMHPFPPLED